MSTEIKLVSVDEVAKSLNVYPQQLAERLQSAGYSVREVETRRDGVILMTTDLELKRYVTSRFREEVDRRLDGENQTYLLHTNDSAFMTVASASLLPDHRI